MDALCDGSEGKIHFRHWLPVELLAFVAVSRVHHSSSSPGLSPSNVRHFIQNLRNTTKLEVDHGCMGDTAAAKNM